MMPFVGGTLILKDGDGRIRFVAEPPPDAAVQVSNNLKNAISYKGAKDSLSNQYTEILTKLYERSNSVSILRDALYRLSELNANIYGDKTEIDQTTVKIFDNILSVVKEVEITNRKIADAQESVAEAKIQAAKTEQLKIMKGDVNLEKAKAKESAGFNYLLKRDLKNALASFQEAENAYPSYHNVYELSKLLRRQNENPDWKAIYREIATQYRWGMSAEMIEQFKKLGL